jgi:capsid protein
LLHGYFDRFDQLRGVSPLSSGINSLKDAYEGIDLASAKAKIAQLFGLKITRQESDELPTSTRLEEGEEINEAEAAGTCDSPHLPEADCRYPVDFGRGPFMLDLDPGDGADVLESRTPSTEFQSFMIEVLQIALKALDIPYSFFAENYTAWSGQRQAWIQYEHSAKSKRWNLRELLDAITSWKLYTWLAAGLIELPAKMEFRHLLWEWVFCGVPWIDMVKEATANSINIGAALESRTRILHEQQVEFDDVVADLIHEKEVLDAAGLPWVVGKAGVLPQSPDAATEEEAAKPANKKEKSAKDKKAKEEVAA